jgi:hypothetical protein
MQGMRYGTPMGVHVALHRELQRQGDQLADIPELLLEPAMPSA